MSQLDRKDIVNDETIVLYFQTTTEKSTDIYVCIKANKLMESVN